MKEINLKFDLSRARNADNPTLAKLEEGGDSESPDII